MLLKKKLLIIGLAIVLITGGSGSVSASPEISCGYELNSNSAYERSDIKFSYEDDVFSVPLGQKVTAADLLDGFSIVDSNGNELDMLDDLRFCFEENVQLTADEAAEYINRTTEEKGFNEVDVNYFNYQMRLDTVGCTSIIYAKFRYTAPVVVIDPVNVYYSTHVENIGWQDEVSNSTVSGTEGQGLRLEGIKIHTDNPNLQINYETHIQNIGLETDAGIGLKSDGAMSGTEGQGLRLEGIRISLSGDEADNYNVFYQVHAQNLGWLGWSCNGGEAGTAGFSYRLEGIRIMVLSKKENPPVNIQIPFVQGCSDYEVEVLSLINAIRAANNLSYVTSDEKLNASARFRAQEISQLFSHQRPDGSRFNSIFQQFGIKPYTWGENIAAGQPDASSVVDGWMHSEGHRENILRPEFTKMGVGYFYTTDGAYPYWYHYWTQLFM